jgi:hypothetical protein
LFQTGICGIGAAELNDEKQTEGIARLGKKSTSSCLFEHGFFD